ncbi:hypothetical protein BOTBODRAFT_180842 [Botryobasidium botryosum FD-172 SS1]|uniref:BTB domain-containing protein n=1 Tax=Botryobasidium botryosum (strain FD-172 SS1) TaxID=930990 RepID=A0A067M5V1_BOTB1|nr:hypothetical protein BOTBODRAFT_180842 [Botryobasidium botryosum FD-172 SS1]
MDNRESMPARTSHGSTSSWRQLRPGQARQEVFWFNDGNIIVRIESRCFRVHRTVLRETGSPYFANLFNEVMHPPNEMVDGCCVYDIEGRGCDFAALLDGLYGQLTCLVEQEPSFFTLACLLRASHRWQVPKLRAWAIQALTRRWPPSLDQVHKQVDLSEHATRLIVLSRECEEKSFLKRAFYRLLSLEDFDLGHKGSTEAGTNAGDASTRGEYDHEKVQWAPADSELAREDILHVVRLQRYAAMFWTLLARKPPSYDFLSDRERHSGWWSGPCSVRLDAVWHKQVTEAGFSIQGGRDPLGCLDNLRDIPWGTLGKICEACVTDCRANWKRQQEAFWKIIDREILDT